MEIVERNDTTSFTQMNPKIVGYMCFPAVYSKRIRFVPYMVAFFDRYLMHVALNNSAHIKDHMSFRAILDSPCSYYRLIRYAFRETGNAITIDSIYGKDSAFTIYDPYAQRKGICHRTDPTKYGVKLSECLPIPVHVKYNKFIINSFNHHAVAVEYGQQRQ